jgi:hypothetical protein
VKVSIKVLKERLENRPQVPPFHFPSWDYPYMRDIKKLEKWVSDFSRVLEQFEIELREKLEEAQNNPSEADAVEVLKKILG